MSITESEVKAPVSSARNPKASNRLKVECLLAWLKDHKPYKPKPSFIPANVDLLSEKFTVRKENHN